LATVLLIQQAAPKRDQYRDLLDYNGFDVFTVDEPEQGIFLAAQQQPNIIVLDFRLAGASGVVIAERLASLPATAHIPLICLITGDHNLELLLHPVAREILTKPVDAADLMRSIWRVLGDAHETS
jgi:two-component system phosphate regulon response regulator PhoB